MKVFITREIPAIGIEILEQAGVEMNIWQQKRPLTQNELIDFCLQSDALLSAGYNNIDAHFLNECRHLKVVSLHSVGFDNVDIAEATKLKIPVGHTPGVLNSATADIAFLLMLAVSRKAFYCYEKIKKGAWKFFEPTADLGIELAGKTVGIFGLGNIGFEMAKRCKGAYDMKVIYHNRTKNLKAEKELDAEWVSFDQLLERSDVISLHSNLSEETRGKFDLDAFQKMKRSCIFINTARGAIHNEEDLIEALEKGIIWGAGLDVTNPEPMDKNNPLLTMPSVAVLPHIGSATVEARNGMARIAAQNVIAGLHGEKLLFPVNPEIYNGLS
ncbi:MAG: 2-hydroxyacid dehydrogenase [Ginsengibacter sp.]